MKVLIDNGYSVKTPGKCSPDGRLRAKPGNSA